ncbi:N-methyl-L-tryptophan oxidase [Phycicoccus sp. Soil802]|uniref:N-methyl-L-tryptophan oxidase n=1 Tax=Phycicoccus sp. Soil802 TaxID=1736414 RepID=UPI0007034F11|nr:N-methyl-L-tryptophan oxidase [Phycicoccus sp. Soil802]KRF22323.1 sarcosine oxidase [Phycicoccus sp. Soil802]
MSDGQLAVIGLGSIGSMALWQASQTSRSVVGLEAASPAHPRSAVGGDTRLFRMTYRGEGSYYPVLRVAQHLWRELEQQSGQTILTQCGGLSIGEIDGSYIPALLESIKRTGAPHEILDHAEMERRYPQHRLAAGECGILDPEGGFLRTDRAVLSAIDAAKNNGASVVTGTPIREIREVPGGVRISTDADTWVFERVIVSSGAWSRDLLPSSLQGQVQTWRIYLSWFAARDPKEFEPERFPIFIRITGQRSLYGAPTLDGASVKATLDGRGQPAPNANSVDRALTAAEIAESEETVAQFLPGLIPCIVRSDAYPDLYTSDATPLVGFVPGSDRIYLATGFSGAGFKMASAFGSIAASEALGRPAGVEGLEFVRPERLV